MAGRQTLEANAWWLGSESYVMFDCERIQDFTTPGVGFEVDVELEVELFLPAVPPPRIHQMGSSAGTIGI